METETDKQGKLWAAISTCERCGETDFMAGIQERRVVVEIVRLCWRCFKVSFEDEALIRASCDVQATFDCARSTFSNGDARSSDISDAAKLYFGARMKSIAAIKAFLTSSTSQ